MCTAERVVDASVHPQCLLQVVPHRVEVVQVGALLTEQGRCTFSTVARIYLHRSLRESVGQLLDLQVHGFHFLDERLLTHQKGLWVGCAGLGAQVFVQPTLLALLAFALAHWAGQTV